MKEPYDAKMICTVIEALLGGSAEPVGETNIDNVKFDRQKIEEEIIYWLLDDMFRGFEIKMFTGEADRLQEKEQRHFCKNCTKLYLTISGQRGKKNETI